MFTVKKRSVDGKAGSIAYPVYDEPKTLSISSDSFMH
jgi:hypothetical protein